MKILMVAAEASPYANVGGFASVIGYLSRALVKRGHEVAIFMPKFGFLDEEKFKLKMVHKGLKVPTGDEATPFLICNIKAAQGPGGVTTYFLENQEYYEKRANVYGYSDDPTRWALLSRGVLEFIKTGIFVPEIVHSNDWHTGIVSDYLKTMYSKDAVLSKISTVFTIHNMHFQGIFDHKHVSELNQDDGKSPVASFFDERLAHQNFMKRGILYSDAVNAVSKTYSKEILTPEFGEALDKLLIEVRSKLFGIVNGIDYDEFDPQQDKLIEFNYSSDTVENRIKNKEALQKEFDLPVDPETLLLGFVGRLDFQKGVDLIVNTLYQVLKDYDVQFVQVGGGDGGIVTQLENLKKAFPKQVGIYPHPNFSLPRMLFAGCDCIIQPSRFEPCGIVQLESMRYGAVPIVRKVGGLADTVENFNSLTGEGTGFVFADFNEFALFGQIVRAFELYKNKPLWQKLVENAMRADFSWAYSAKEYEKLYDRAQSLKNKKQPDDKLVEAILG